MKRESVGRLGSLLFAFAVAGAAAAAVTIAVSTAATAAPANAKPVVVGQLVLGGATANVTAYSWEVTAASNWTSGGGASVGKPNPGAIHFTKAIDPSSVPTLLKIAQGAAYPSALFSVTLGKGKAASTMVYELEDVFVTRVSQGTTDGLVTEEVSLVFKVVRWTFTSSAGDVTTGTWDVVSGSAS
jgi:type VI protein secretion system component Hcp